jgi:hypothetical protein
MNRLVIVARLNEGAHADAQELIAAGPPFEPDELGFHRHGVYLTATDVVFVFEAPEVEWLVNDIIDHPVFAAALAPWRGMVDGPPRFAHEHYFWARGQDEVGVGLGV